MEAYQTTITGTRSRGYVLTKEELEGWHRHVDFSCLHILILAMPLDSGALRWLQKCNFASSKELTFQLYDRNDAGNERAMYLAKEFVRGLSPLSRLVIADSWRMLPPCMNIMLLQHGASLRTLRVQPRNGISARTAFRMLKTMRNLCPQLTELSLTVLRDQGGSDERRLYESFAGFLTLRRLALVVVTGGELASRYVFGDQRAIVRIRRTRYDDFDQQMFESVTSFHNFRYGDIRRAFIDKAIDEDFARTVYRLACAPDRPRSLEEFVLMSDPYFFVDAQRRSSLIQPVFSHICRSWTVQPGVRDDMPDELVVREMDTPREIKVDPAPEKLDPRVEQIFRRIWPGSEDGSSDWQTDWHSFLKRDNETDEPKNLHVSQA